VEEVPVDEYTLPLSKAEVVVEGEKCDGVINLLAGTMSLQN